MPYAQLLQWAEADFAVLGTEKRCTGESARRMDDEFLFQEFDDLEHRDLQQS